jgi:hypothetical protein
MNAIDGGEGQRRYAEAGSPIIPSLLVGGRTFPIMHPSQIASLLALPGSESSVDSVRLGWDTISILDNWVDLLPQSSWESLVAPTPSRGRSVRNLTVNTFRPFELLMEAWHNHTFRWYTGEADAERERPLVDREMLARFARGVLRRWEDFLMETGEELEEDPEIESNRGTVPYSVILRSQKWHAAFHHRQIVAFLRSEGVGLEGALDVEAFEDLELPREIY